VEVGVYAFGTWLNTPDIIKDTFSSITAYNVYKRKSLESSVKKGLSFQMQDNMLTYYYYYYNIIVNTLSR